MRNLMRNGRNDGYSDVMRTMIATKSQVDNLETAVMALPKPCVAGSIPAGGAQIRSLRAVLLGLGIGLGHWATVFEVFGLIRTHG
jgi:hypothetical protein